MRKDHIFRGLKEQAGEISLESIGPTGQGAIKKTNVKLLTSYNILNKGRQTIVVPGFPPVWVPGYIQRHVRPDAGPHLVDPTRHVFPWCPLEPLFRALSITRPWIKLQNFDLITDRQNLRLLLGFVNGKQQPFRIGMQVVGNTVLFSRWLPKTKGYVRTFQGYGHDFERVYTRRPWGVKHSITHHRVISYTLGDVKTILRYEVDGCASSSTDKFAKMSSSYAGTSPTGFTLTKWGKLVAPSRILEIKTAPIGRNIRTTYNMEQLWFADTPILCAGKYDASGKFTQITQENCIESGTLGAWEERHQEKLKKLAALLRLIVDRARSASWTNCALVCSEGRLKIFNLANKSEDALPVDLEPMFGSPHRARRREVSARQGVYD